LKFFIRLLFFFLYVTNCFFLVDDVTLEMNEWKKKMIFHFMLVPSPGKFDVFFCHFHN
jgi:hypothetical protein